MLARTEKARTTEIGGVGDFRREASIIPPSLDPIEPVGCLMTGVVACEILQKRIEQRPWILECLLVPNNGNSKMLVGREDVLQYGSVQESAFPFSFLYNSIRSPARWARRLSMSYIPLQTAASSTKTRKIRSEARPSRGLQSR